MLICGPGHHRTSTQVSEDVHRSVARSHEYGVTSTPKAEQLEDAVVTSLSLLPRVSHTPDLRAAPRAGAGAGAGLEKCSACAACCTAVFLPPPILAFSGRAPAGRLMIDPVLSRIVFVTDGPDRPPRTSIV